MAKPATKSLEFTQGDDVEEFYRIKDSDGNLISLTGWSGKAQMRDSSDTLLIEFDVTIDEDSAPSLVLVSCDKTETEAIAAGGTYKWDLELIRDDGFKRTYLSGPVVVNPQVTKEEA